jgi:hypothetical protein
MAQGTFVTRAVSLRQGIAFVAQASAHSARILLACSETYAKRVTTGSSEILTPAWLNLRERSGYGHS